MAVRFLANAGRIIMSKSGYDASPTLPDQFKLFDSNWMATGLVIATGTYQMPSSGDGVVPFPYPLHYAPAADVYLVSDGSNGSNDLGGRFLGGYTTQSALIITTTATWRNRLVRYIIWAVSI